MGKHFKAKFGAGAVLSCLVFFLALGTVFTGCATRAPMQTQLDLGSCGFHWKIAQTPEQLKHLQSLPQRQIVRHKKDGEYLYVYADAEDCKCIFVGNEKAYHLYMQIVREKNVETKKDIAIDETNLMVRDSDIINNWAVWGDMPMQ
jgi:hypothetical protein